MRNFNPDADDLPEHEMEAIKKKEDTSKYTMSPETKAKIQALYKKIDEAKAKEKPRKFLVTETKETE